MAISTEAKVYKYDDANAPVLSGQRGSLCALLKTCLVDGYTDRPSAGWSIQYQSDDEQIMVFRSGLDGNDHVLRVDEQTAPDAQTVKLQGFELLMDIDNGVGAFPREPIGDAYSYNQASLYKSDQESSYSRAWAIIANEVCFYLIIWHTVGTVARAKPMSVFFFGDFINFNQNDSSFNTLLALSGGSYYSNDTFWKNQCGLFGWQGGNSSQSSVPSARYHYDADIWHSNRPLVCSPRGTNTLQDPVEQFWMICGGGPCHRAGWYGGRRNRLYITGEAIPLVRPAIPDTNFNQARGWVPGLYVPTSYLPHDPLDTITTGDSTYLYFCGGQWRSTDDYGFMINLTNFWA